ncbi:hypothetical protein MRX96_042652 [Rhipicephalus microplus]
MAGSSPSRRVYINAEALSAKHVTQEAHTLGEPESARTFDKTLLGVQQPRDISEWIHTAAAQTTASRHFQNILRGRPRPATPPSTHARTRGLSAGCENSGRDNTPVRYNNSGARQSTRCSFHTAQNSRCKV